MKPKSSLLDAFFARGKVADCPVYDMHGHMGPFYGAHFPQCRTEDMVAAMDLAGVAMLVFCHHSALMSPDRGNADNIAAVRRFPRKLRAYCGVNPNYPKAIRQSVETFDRFRDVFVGFKMLADYHRYPITDARYQPAWEKANDERLLVLLHTWGGSPFDGPGLVRQVAGKYPGATLLLGHSCHSEWDQATALVKDFPNVYLELCAVVDERGILERFVEKVGSERLVFGTDFPWFNHHYYIGGVLGAGLSDEDCRNILSRNARRLLASTGVEATAQPGRKRP